MSRKWVTILSIVTVILVAGLAVTIYLVRRNQELRERASSGAACSQSGTCILLDNPGNSGSYVAPKVIGYVDITNQSSYRYNPGTTNDGCYVVQIQGANISWNKIGPGPSCKDISNIQIWLTDQTLTPTPTTEVPTATPTTPVTQTGTPTPGPSSTPTPTTASTGTPTPTSPQSTSTVTATRTPTATPTSGSNPSQTPTPTTVTQNTQTPSPTQGLIAQASPTPGGSNLPAAGVGTPTIFFSMFSVIIFIFAGALLFL